MAALHVRSETADGVARITLDRPDVLNSFNHAMAAELRDAIAAAAADDVVRAVLLTGAGRAFCAGQDLAAVLPAPGAPEPDLGDIVRECYNPVVRALRAIEKPVVAAVNGVAAGAGANLAFACDFVVAAETASFIQSFCHIGLIPDSGGTFVLPRLVGMARATQLAMLGEKLPARQALAGGMIYQVVELAQLDEAATALARRRAAMPTRGLGLI
ncbi:MAG: enoyl-CoA hydratase-related protein, partial [Gemmatirosa sp.]